jgi:hypothetical protein
MSPTTMSTGTLTLFRSGLKSMTTAHALSSVQCWPSRHSAALVPELDPNL